MSTAVSRSAATVRRDSIRAYLEAMIDAKEQIVSLITAAKDNDDHLAFGYASWPAYVSAEYGGLLVALDRDDRRLAVLALSETGMSTRAIAPLVGVSKSAVDRDLRQVSHCGTPAGNDPVANVIGLDAKRYPARLDPARLDAPPRRVRRQTSPKDAVRDAAYDLSKALARIERALASEKFTGNRALIASDLTRHRARLTTIISLLEDVTS